MMILCLYYCATARTCAGGEDTPTGGAFLVDIPTGPGNRGLSNSPTGQIAYSADWRRQSRPVRVLYRPALS